MFTEAAGLDMILVGDSLGMVVLGYPGTIPVTMEDCISHCKAVRRGAPNTFVMGDMPFGSYQVSDEQAVENAVRFFKEADVDAVKLEGGVRVESRIKAIADSGVLVCGHIGLTPQSSGPMGGFKVMESSEMESSIHRVSEGTASRLGQQYPQHSLRIASKVANGKSESTASIWRCI